MLNDKPKFAIVAITGETLKAIERGLETTVKNKAIMPVWLITKSEKRYLAILGSNAISLDISSVTDEERTRTVWLPEGDIEILAEMEGVLK
jgi:hypothetical protein